MATDAREQFRWFGLTTACSGRRARTCGVESSQRTPAAADAGALRSKYLEQVMQQHRDIEYYPKDKLSLKQDVPGAKMWGVALEKAMLTYFEVEPDSRFDMHKHESEQITLVLDGVLYFELHEQTVAVGAGEVIAIPSNVEHAVYTETEAVRAVDAWSPVREEYRNEKS